MDHLGIATHLKVIVSRIRVYELDEVLYACVEHTEQMLLM